MNADFVITPEMLEETKLESRRACMPEVDALIAAGWLFELPEIVNRKEGDPPRMETEPWQWYWRAPKKGNRTQGRKYWSTTQAYNALKRQTDKQC